MPAGTTIAKTRTRLLTGLNLLVGTVLVLWALEKISATRYLVSDGLLVVLLLVTFLAVPPALGAFIWFGRRSALTLSSRLRLYTRLSLGFVSVGWLLIALPALFWGAIFLRAWEPWPLSLRQGPDTAYAKDGFEQLFGHPTSESLSSLYFYSFNVRDATYYVRFDYDDPAVIDTISQSRDLVRAPAEARADTRFDLRASDSHLGWWPPDRINETQTIYVDRATGDKIAGRIPWNSPVGRTRLLWVDEESGTAFYRELEF